MTNVIPFPRILGALVPPPRESRGFRAGLSWLDIETVRAVVRTWPGQWRVVADITDEGEVFATLERIGGRRANFQPVIGCEPDGRVTLDMENWSGTFDDFVEALTLARADLFGE